MTTLARTVGSQARQDPNGLTSAPPKPNNPKPKPYSNPLQGFFHAKKKETPVSDKHSVEVDNTVDVTPENTADPVEVDYTEVTL